MGNSIPDGTHIEMFKRRSVSGYFMCYCDGPIAVRSIRHDRTSLSSCKAEIITTSKYIKAVLALRLVAQDLGADDLSTPTIVYNDNQAYIEWAAAVATKGVKHLTLRDNKI
jgi:hypothetical protein